MSEKKLLESAPCEKGRGPPLLERNAKSGLAVFRFLVAINYNIYIQLVKLVYALDIKFALSSATSLSVAIEYIYIYIYILYSEF